MEIEGMVDMEDGLMWTGDMVKHPGDVACTTRLKTSSNSLMTCDSSGHVG